MQSCSTTLQNHIYGISRSLGVELYIENIPVVFCMTKQLSPSGQGTPQPILFGQGYKFGQQHPQYTRTIVFGDTVSTQTQISASYTIIDISNINYEIDLDSRIPVISSLEIDIYRNSDNITHLDNATLLGRRARLRIGLDTTIGNSITLFEGIIKERDINTDNTITKLRLEHYWSFAKDNIFARPMSALTNDITSTQTSITIDDASDFPQTGTHYIKIDEELIKYTAINQNTLTCARGIYTNAASHKKGTQVEYCKIYESGIKLTELLLQVLTSTGSGTNGSYDVLPAGCGLGIPIQYIDIDSFVNYINPGIAYYNDIYPIDANNNQTFDLFFYENIEAKRFFKNILTMLNAYLIITNDCILKLIPITPSGSLYPIWSSNNSIKLAKSENSEIINCIVINIFSTKFNIWEKTKMEFKQNDSIIKYGKKENEIDFVLWTSFLAGFPKPGQEPNPLEEEEDPRHLYIDYALHYYLLKSKEPRNIIDTTTTFQRLLYELGDRVSFINYITNNQYNTYIIKREVDIKNCQINFNLMEVI